MFRYPVHKQSPARQARPNPLDDLRGMLDAVDLPGWFDVSINAVSKMLVDAGLVVQLREDAQGA